MGKTTKKIPLNAFSRASRLLASGAKVVVQEVASQIAGSENVLATRLKQTQELVSTIGQLKGAAMKAGQMLSMEASDLLHPEIVKILRQLQDDTAFMPIDQVRLILSRQLGREKLGYIEDLSFEPIAAASIGQVHRATIGGQPVAIKIQYPGVAKSIDSDLAVLKKLAAIAMKIYGKTGDVDPIVDEIAKSLKKEVDYRLEAKNIALFRSLVTDSSYVIPKVFDEYSTDTVLTLSFEEGIKINHWIASEPAAAEVEYFASLVLNLLIAEMVEYGVVQTDPNFANFLYRPQDRKLVLLDFGATNMYQVELRELLRTLTLAALSGETDLVLKEIIKAGYLHPNESALVMRQMKDLLALIGQLAEESAQPFPFRNDLWLNQIRSMGQSLAESVEFTLPPKDLLFLGRKLGGMFHMLKDLNAKVDMIAIKQRLYSVPIKETAK